MAKKSKPATEADRDGGFGLFWLALPARRGNLSQSSSGADGLMTVVGQFDLGPGADAARREGGGSHEAAQEKMAQWAAFRKERIGGAQCFARKKPKQKPLIVEMRVRGGPPH